MSRNLAGRCAIGTLLLAVPAGLACGSIAGHPSSAAATAAASQSRTDITPPASAPGSPNPCAADPLPGRGNPAATQDLSRNQTVLFGGTLANSTVGADTWLFDGHCWHEVEPIVHPSARWSAALVYDEALNVSLLIGGRNEGANGPQTFPGDAWIWDGKHWSQVVDAPHFVDVAAAYDVGRHVVVVAGSTTTEVGTWIWDGSQWTRVSQDLPTGVATDTSAVCFDRSDDTTVLFGGLGIGVPINANTWSWDGAHWTQLHPLHSPSPRFSAVLSCAAQPVLFGGIGGQTGPGLTDTWGWNGGDWEQLRPAHSPDATAAFGVVEGQRDVIFIATTPSQTWVWTGTDWSRLT